MYYLASVYAVKMTYFCLFRGERHAAKELNWLHLELDLCTVTAQRGKTIQGGGSELR